MIDTWEDEGGTVATEGQRRWRFEKDDDGHNYLIPAYLQKQFNLWIEEELYDDADYCGEDFNAYRIDGGHTRFTFTDPLEDE